MNFAFIGAVGAAVGAAAAYGYMSSQRPQSPAVVPIATSSIGGHPVIRFGIPIRERVRVFSGYVAGFDPATRNPAWVLEHLNKETCGANAGDRSKSNFVEDAVIPARFRSKLSDYKGSGYDRGHMTPAMTHKASQARMDDTFSLTNMSPQVGKGFNQDYWARFEKFVKDVTRKANDVFVVTGPIFLPTLTPQGFRAEHGFIGQFPQLVGVPTHYYKVVLAETAPQRYAVAAFVMPNKPIPAQTPLSSFVMPLEVLESVTGIQFFPALLSDSRRMALDVSAVDWRRLGKAQQQALALEGVQQVPESIAVADGALVPAGKLPPFTELIKTGVASGPPAFRPRPTGAAGAGAVHLCEHVACQLPRENFWEAASATGGGKSGRQP